ncbi:MAG: flagellar basal-body MS-ring/collar protein FliF [Pseudomonadota bacterium]
MSNFLSAWEAMQPQRKVVVVLGSLAILVVLAMFVRVATMPSMALLYSGLDPQAASGVIEGLERQNIPYELRNDAIFVPSDTRDRARISLAGEGLPAAGAAGYELLDTLSGFGTTSQMFDAAYWRAKEGELARTILASPQVIRARVHIAQTRRRPFEQETQATASVIVSMSAGSLGRQQAEAIRYLVASAVAGLMLENVAVIDQENGVVLRSGETETAQSASADPTARAASLRRSVERLLEARVGPGAAIVEVSVDTVRESETVRERVLDPSSQVVIHTDTEETSEQAQGSATGVTVASNLPDGEVEGGEGSNRQTTESRERINYEVSEVIRERVSPPGEVRRITVAVMVDGLRGEAADGSLTWAPRPEEELASLKQLVESAVGFDAARGDVVTIQSLEFNGLGEQGSLAEAGFMDFLSVNAMSIIQLVTLALVALMLGLFVIRPILNVDPPAPELGVDGDPTLIDGTASTIDASIAQAGEVIDAETVDEDRLSNLREAVLDQPEEAVRLLRNWLDDMPEQEEKAA